MTGEWNRICVCIGGEVQRCGQDDDVRQPHPVNHGDHGGRYSDSRHGNCNCHESSAGWRHIRQLCRSRSMLFPHDRLLTSIAALASATAVRMAAFTLTLTGTGFVYRCHGELPERIRR